MKRKNAITIFSMLIIVQLSIGQVSQDRLHYISKYYKIAQEEMERTGVPASIKLAQAILESNGGKSELSRKANNHFGIKCGGSWNARTYFRIDDDKDDKGNAIESCFRVYKNPESSFIAHSEFLRGNKRYNFLFDMELDDYKSWAHGLKKAGYATNPKYPHLLIKIIKDYELDQYDKLFELGPGPMIAATGDDFMLNEIARIEGKKKQPKSNQARKKSKKSNFLATNHRKTADKKLNDISIIYADYNDTPESIAAKTNVPLKRLFKYNEDLTDPNQVLLENSVVFLQPKRKAFRGKKKYHKVSDGETLTQVSKKYGIQIDKLKDRNRLAANEEPLEGAIIKIRGRRVPENMSIPTREVYMEGMSNSQKEAAKVEKYATSLSDFEVPPTLEERKAKAKKEKKKSLFSFGSKEEVSTDMRDDLPPADSYKASPAYEDEVVEIENRKSNNDTYTATTSQNTSSNYNTTPATGNATFKEEVRATHKPYNNMPSVSKPYTSASSTQVTSQTVPSTSADASRYATVDHSQSTSTYSSQNSSTMPTPATTNTGGTTYTARTDTKISKPQVITTKYHTVSKGETLYRLSKNYGKSVDYLKQVNGLNSNTISIGQKLIVN